MTANSSLSLAAVNYDR